MSVEIIDCTVGMLISGCSITEAAEANGRPVSTIHHLSRNTFKLALHKIGLAAGDLQYCQ
jgi:hypothetical protein